MSDAELSVPRDAEEADLRLLHALLEARGPIRRDRLSLSLGLEPAAIGRAVRNLLAMGNEIEDHPAAGLRLQRSSLTCWADYLQPRHRGGTGRIVRVYRQTGSTQSLARQLLAGGGDCRGTVIVADHQTAGRGRFERRWFAPAGSSLLLTAIVPWRGADHTPDRLMLCTACALSHCVESLGGEGVAIRWPNDLLLHGRKLAGVLVELAEGMAMIGIGLNVSVRAEDLPQTDGARTVDAVSLAMHDMEVDRLLVLDRLLSALDRCLVHETIDSLREQWQRRSSLYQQRITVEHDGSRMVGRVMDIDPISGLILLDDRGVLHTLPAASTTLVQ